MEQQDRLALQERLLARRVIAPNGCWLWGGFCEPRGYGRIRAKRETGLKRPLLVHRASAAAFLGFDLESRVCCLHTCDNPPCFNPDHLFFGDRAANTEDRDRKGRGRQPRGSRVGTARLDERRVTRIIRLLQRGRSMNEVARSFGVHPTTVWEIAHRKRWAHVLPEETIPIRASMRGRLKAEQAREIKQRLAAGESYRAIAERFGIAQSSVGDIAHGRSWARVKL